MITFKTYSSNIEIYVDYIYAKVIDVDICDEDTTNEDIQEFINMDMTSLVDIIERELTNEEKEIFIDRMTRYYNLYREGI